MKINIKSSGITMAIILLFLSVLPVDVSWYGYIDDVVPLLFGSVWIYKFLNSNRKLNSEKLIFIFLLVICTIGLLSNLLSKYARIYPTILDMYSFLKMFFVYLGTYALLWNKKETTSKIIKNISKFGKIFIIIGFIFGIFNLIGIVNMYSSVRFGIKNYHFIYKNASQYGILVGVAFAFVVFSGTKYLKFYEIAALSTMLMTMKGMALISVVVYVSMNLVVKKKIKIWQIVVVGILLVFVLRYQVYTYLLDENAPRAILIRLGAKTANDHFPFGAGFATWGSDAAGKYYSPLYLMYGLNMRNAFIYDYAGGTALNDAYLGMAIGQFGWIGAFLLIIVLVLIGKKLFTFQNGKEKQKYISYALFASFCGMAIMAGSIKGAPGQLILFTIQVYSLLTTEKGKQKKSMESNGE